MKKLYIATLVAVLFASFAFEAEAGRCRRRCEKVCAPCPPKPECCVEEVTQVCEKPICERTMTYKVCAEPKCKKTCIINYECPTGYNVVGSEEVVRKTTESDNNY